MGYSVLFVDDEKSVHIILEKLLGDQFDVIHTYSAQEAINIISEKPVNLLLCDIEMPGMTGLELLESIQQDKNNKEIPFLILTSHDSENTEREAYNLGAEDFISKTELLKKRHDFLERVQMKLISNVDVPNLDNRLLKAKNEVINSIMKKALRKDFQETAKVALESLYDCFDIEYGALWIQDQQDEWELAYDTGLDGESPLLSNDLQQEKGFRHVLETRSAYLNNNISEINLEKLMTLRDQKSLPSQIGIPLFAMNEKNMLMNNLEVPKDVPVFGYLFLLGNKLISSKEFELLSKIVMQSGAILWRLVQSRLELQAS